MGGVAGTGSGSDASGGARGGRGGGGQAGTGDQSGGAGGSHISADCPGAAYEGTRPTPLTLSGSLSAHDPAALVAGGTIYLAATGLVAKTSPDLKTWQAGATPLALPDWARTATGAKDLWAPDLASFGGAYHLYYSASTFGSNKSCIGQATRADLAAGAWTDQGMVVCSNAGGTKDDWNAIDPNIVLDEAGTPWMVFGSFWSGIKAVKLDASGRRADNEMHAIANHADGGIEGAWVFRRCGLYYLFVSWGACCNGAYDYNIRVGRAPAITGPYVDKAGSPMLSGGGTQLVKGDASWVAPGHNAVLTYGGKTYNLYHALKGSSTGAATLRISELLWDADGWPVSGGP